MRCLLALLAAVAIVASACGGTSERIEATAESIELTPAGDVVDDAADTAPVVEDGDEAAEAEPVALRTGREAILANHSEGKPYVLWYWGAH